MQDQPPMNNIISADKLRKHLLHLDHQRLTRELYRNKEMNVSPFSVLSERDAVGNEILYFEPLKSGIGFAVVMITIFIAVTFSNLQIAPFTYSLSSIILFIGFYFWFRSNKKNMKPFKVNTLQGNFNKFVNEGNKTYLHISDIDRESESIFSVPRSWRFRKGFPLSKKNSFEVRSGTNQIVSIGNSFSISEDFKTKHSIPQYYLWMIATVLTFVLCLAYNTNLRQAETAIQMLFSPPPMPINTIQDWSKVKVGQQIESANMHIQCSFPEDDSKINIKWKGACSQFVVVDKDPNTDFYAVIEDIVNDLVKLKGLEFPPISDAGYALLVREEMISKVTRDIMNPYSNIRKYRQESSLANQDKIVIYNSKILSNWARWIEDNNVEDEYIKNSLLFMWGKITKKECENCWDDMIKWTEGDVSGYSYTERSRVSFFQSTIDSYPKKLVSMILARWGDIFVSVSEQNNIDISVTAIGMDTPSSWNDLLDFALNPEKNEKMIDELLLLIETTQSQLKKIESNSINYAVVTSMESNEQEISLVIDFTMSKQVQLVYLVKITILIFLLVALLIMLWLKYSKFNRTVIN